MSAVIDQIDALCSILEMLQNCVLSTADLHLNAVAPSENSIPKCSVAIDQLRQILTKCQQTNMPATSKERMQMLTRRLAIPIRHSTSLEVRDTVTAL